MNPYLITAPTQIGISRGRPRGHMLYKILEVHGGTLPPNMHLFFQNTGKEREETLIFIDQIAKRWNVNIAGWSGAAFTASRMTHSATSWWTSRLPSAMANRSL